MTRFGLLGATLGLLAVAWASGWTDWLTLDSLRLHHDALRSFVAARPAASALVFMAVYVLATSASLPGESLLTLTGGYLFGTWLGGGLTAVAATIGAVVAFQAARAAFGRGLRRAAEARQGRLKAVSDGVRKGALGYILTLRLLPVVPFWMVNVAGGLADAPLKPYVLATFFGILPAVFVYSAVGAGLGAVLESGETPDLSLLAEPRILYPLIGLALLALASAAYRAWRR